MRVPTIRSLCSGYGGLDIAAEVVTGGRLVDHAEVDRHAALVHEAHWPGLPNLEDITAVDWADLEPTDVLVAGYPCQPFSQAGRRRGAKDARHLWPHVAAAVRVLRPRLVLLENVAGHLSLGFGTVLGDLAEAGYDARWTCLRASDVGACHRRERVFIVATPADAGSAGAGWDGRAVPSTPEGVRWPGVDVHAALDARAGAAPDADGEVGRAMGDAQRRNGSSPAAGRGATESRGRHSDVAWASYADAIRRHERVLGRPAPHPTDQRGRLSPNFVEWMMMLPDGWVTDVPGIPRTAQLKMLGNGVIPAQAFAAYRSLIDVRELAA